MMRTLLYIVLSIVTFSECNAAESPRAHANGEDKVPSNLISLGEGNPGYAIIVDKASQRLFIYDSSYNVAKTVTVTTGKKQGNKRQMGDRKTPEGIYFFTDVMEKKKLLPEYGVLALPTNYPNLIDVAKCRNGGGIWLHATNRPGRPLKPYDSKGCVVTANEDILDIAEYIELELTPVVTVDSIAYVSPEKLKEERAEITSFLTQWKENWESRDIESYISNYSEQFKSGSMDREGWRSYKEQINQRNSDIKIEMKDLKILRNDGYVVAAFIQDYRGDSHRDLGIKRLYLARESEGWKIVGEEWREIPAKDPKVIAMAYHKRPAEKKEENPKVEYAYAKAAEPNTDMTDNLASLSPRPGDDNESHPPITHSRWEGRDLHGKGPKLVDIEDFSLDKEKALKVQFRLVNKGLKRGKIKGRIVTVVEGKNDKGAVYASYPELRVRGGKPLHFKDAEWFSINRFKVVKGKIGDTGLDDSEIGQVKVWVYSQDGKLLLVKEFSGDGAAL